MNQHVRLRGATAQALAVADAYSDGIAEGERRSTEKWIETVITLMQTGRLVVPMATGGFSTDARAST